MSAISQITPNGGLSCKTPGKIHILRACPNSRTLSCRNLKPFFPGRSADLAASRSESGVQVRPRYPEFASHSGSNGSLNFSSPPMKSSARNLVFSSRIASKQVYLKVSNAIQGSTIQYRENTVAASFADSSLKPEKSRKRVSLQERRAIVEAFVDQYRASNAGRFPPATHTRQRTGGSYYNIRKIIQELKYNQKMSLLNKNKEIQVGRVEKAIDPGLTVNVLSESSNIEFQRPTVAASSTSVKDIHEGSTLMPKVNIFVDVDQLVMDKEVERTDKKEHSPSVDVESITTKESLNPSRVKVSSSRKQKNTNDFTVDDEVVFDSLGEAAVHRNDITNTLVNGSLPKKDHQCTKTEADSLLSIKLENSTTVNVSHSSPLESEGKEEDLKSTGNLQDTNGSEGVEQVGNFEAPKASVHSGIQSRKSVLDQSSPKRSGIWGNLKAIADGIFSFWKKR